MGEQTLDEAGESSAAILKASLLPNKLLAISTKAATPSTTTTTATTSTAASTVSESASPALPLSPTLMITPPESTISGVQKEDGLSSFTASAATLHKKDSGTSMASSVESLQSDRSHNSGRSSPVQGTAQPSTESGSYQLALAPRRSHLLPHPLPSSSSLATAAPDSRSPSGKVLSRPLSTSKLSSTPLAAPHILPNQRYAGFNLAALGQLSPPASAGASLTMSRADTLAFLNANGPSQNSYFSLSATPSGTTTAATGGDSSSGSETGGEHGQGASHRTMCGSDAISLLDLEDPHNDLVMIDSNGNSSGSGVTGAAMVGESMASALAIVSHHHQSAKSYLGGNSSHAGSEGNSGLGGSLAAGLTMTASASSAFLAGVAGSTGTLLGIDHSGFLGESGSGGGDVGGALGSGGTISGGSNLQPRSSLPSLTSQARKDVLQRAAIIAALQQNGGAKIMAAHRMGRRQDRPSRNIRFGEFHRICEIEYGFDEGKPLLANGRILVHSASVQRIETDDSQEEMQLYLFSDVLVSGTKIGSLLASSTMAAKEDIMDPCMMEELKPEGQEDVDEEQRDDDTDSTTSTFDQGSPTLNALSLEPEGEKGVLSATDSAIMRNPYAGYLKNQKICRLTQVQADAVEKDERPLLKVTGPHFACIVLFESAQLRDGFLKLLNETILAHKHHLLFQSKYLADLKKFKRHSAFSFDTSFLKTWGLHNGLNLGSTIRPNGNGAMGHNYYSSGTGSPSNGSVPNTFDGTGTLTSSPLVSPGGAFDLHQYQQHLNRPQSMAGSLFSFAMNGGSFPSFSSTSDHGKDASTASSASYATLKGTNAAKALQYHHHQQQILQNRLSQHAVASNVGNAGGGSSSPSNSGYQSQRSSAVIDRSSSGSSFDPIWFLKASNYQSDTTRPTRRAVSAADIVHLHTDLDGTEGDQKVEEVSAEALLAMKASKSSLDDPARSLAMDLTSTITPSNLNHNRISSASLASLIPTSSSHSSTAAVRNITGWVRDEDAAICMVCSITKFGVLVRKHHCRLCGRVICWKCCQMKDAGLFGEQGLLAVARGGGSGHGGGTIVNIGGITGELGVTAGGKAIRVCLDCIEQHQETAAEIQHHLQRNPRRVSAPTSPTSSTTSFPHNGVFGKLMSVNTAGGTSHVAPAVVTPGSASPFYPRLRSGLVPHPHHHRASLYRIDVERVGEEDEEEDEEEKEKMNATVKAPSRPPLPSAGTVNTIVGPTEQHMTDEATSQAFSEEELVKEEIMSLESEVESLLIHQSSVAAAVVAASGSSPTVTPARPFDKISSRGGSGLSGNKTRVLRGIPKELLTQHVYQSVAKNSAVNDLTEDEVEEEKSMEELLREQDEHLMNLMG
ncbi:hypothetical protein EMPS_01020 [Entomortierella parvispora]|uniref:FYVE-type domain-containing protein n=1 Tax=Entomortierella parvispora TaxID=205924 RepID=A0A9P3H272_9FUNG|nr:hypothetical protein EMPS_01020 [Entomortierella parvispora]